MSVCFAVCVGALYNVLGVSQRGRMRKLCVTVFHHISDVDRGVNAYDK